MIVVFLPVSLYKVKFKVAAGRPFSRFERLVLRAIGAGTNQLDDLVKLFCVHRRMVVESLVTLMQAGWVSIASPNNQFALTASGVDATSHEKSLPALLYTEDRWQIIVMERVAGQVAQHPQHIGGLGAVIDGRDGGGERLAGALAGTFRLGQGEGGARGFKRAQGLIAAALFLNPQSAHEAGHALIEPCGRGLIWRLGRS